MSHSYWQRGITKAEITIVSHPGPDISISDASIKAGTMKGRRYRNRRIGDFLKELKFTEGRGTGIPKMKYALKSNGSPDPIFYSDDARQSFWTEIPIHPEFLENVADTPIEAPDEAHDEAHDEAYDHLNQTELQLLKLCQLRPINMPEILAALGYTTITGNLKKALAHLKSLELIELTIKDKPRSKNQRYRLTQKEAQQINLKN